MTVVMQTIPDVPLVSTGTYALASGDGTFTEEDLQSALAAFQDPGIVAPRVKLGHTDPRFAEAAAATEDGEPALGHITNPRLSDDGQTLYGDLVVPQVLAENAQWAYPARSIEGFFGWESPSGRTYDFVITAVALLGTQLPGVSTLDDLWEFLSDVGEGVAPTAAVVASAPARARAEPITASLDVDLIRRRLVDMLDEQGGDMFDLPPGSDGWSWWPRALRVDDDGSSLYYVVTDESTGTLWRMDVTVSGTEVTFSDPTEVVEQYVAASAAPRRRPPVATWATRGEARASTPTNTEDRMTDAQRRALALAYGLDADATVEQVNEAVAAGDPPTAPEPEPTPAPEGDPAPEPEPTPAPEGDPEAVAAGGGERTVTVSREVLAGLQRDAAEGAAARAEQIRQDRDALVSAAVADGRITPVEAGMERGADGNLPDGWRRDMDEAPEVTARRLAALRAGVNPVGDPVAASRQESSQQDPGLSGVLASFGSQAAIPTTTSKG